MRIKHELSENEYTILNKFFESMVHNSNAALFQQLGIHHSWISFNYQMGDIVNNDGLRMSLPMTILLVETHAKTRFCLVEQFIEEHFFIKDINKFSDMNTDLQFLNQKETKHVGLCFESFDELNKTIKRILDYTALLIFDDISKTTMFH